MKNKIIVPTFLFIVVLFFSFFVLLQDKNKNKNQTNAIAGIGNQSESQIIFFYGDGCPHCKIVEKYIDENNIRNKILFSQKEVYHNRNNAKELEAKAKICGLPTNSIGVPFLWDGKKCLVGDQNVINFFKQQINEQ